MPYAAVAGSEGRKADEEVVLAAAKQDGRALASASQNLRADKEVVLAAVKQNGRVLADASEDLAADKEVVLAAVSAATKIALVCMERSLLSDGRTDCCAC